MASNVPPRPSNRHRRGGRGRGRGRSGGQPASYGHVNYRDMMAKIEASLEHLPSFLVYINRQLGGSVLQNEFLYRHDVTQHWPPFSVTRTIRLPNGEDARVSPSNVCFALIRTYSPSGARPKAQVQDRNLIQLGQRALDAIRDGFDRRHDLMKAHLDIKSRR